MRGKVVLVNFWATSCPGCIKEMPGMVETYKQYKDKGFEIIAVAMPYDPPNYVLKFAEDWQLPFPVALDVKGEAVAAFGNVSLTPTNFLIGKDGARLEKKIGELDFAKLKATLDRETLDRDPGQRVGPVADSGYNLRRRGASPRHPEILQQGGVPSKTGVFK